MRKTNSQQLSVVYEFVPPGSAGAVDAERELERAFDILFDIVIKEIEEEARAKTTT